MRPIRRSFPCLLWLLLAGLAVVSAVPTQAQNRPAPRAVIAVLYPANQTGDVESEHWLYTIQEQLSRSLRSVHGVRVLPSEAIQAAYRQTKRKPGADLDHNVARQMGQLLEAQWVVVGNYERKNINWIVTVEMVGVKNGAAPKERVAASQNWVDICGRLAQQVLGELQISPTLPELERMGRAETDSTAALTWYSRALQSAGRERPTPQETQSLLKRAQTADPQFAAPLRMQGRLRLAERQYEMAEAVLRECLQRQPDDAAAHSELAQALLGQKKTAEAEAELQQALRLDPFEPVALKTLALRSAARGKSRTETQTLAQQARQSNPLDPEIRALLLRLRTGKKNWEGR